jgi:hypothetical protein
MKLSSGELKKKIQELLPNVGKIKRIRKERDSESGYVERTFSVEDEIYSKVMVRTNITDQFLIEVSTTPCLEGPIFESSEDLYDNLPVDEKREMLGRLIAIVTQESEEDKDKPYYKDIHIRIEHDNSPVLYLNDFDAAPLEDIELFRELGRDWEDTDYSLDNSYDHPVVDKFRTDGVLDLLKVVNYIQDSGIKICDKRTKEAETEERVGFTCDPIYYYKTDTEKHRERQLKKIKNNN